ncbi:CbtB domain-containing protein [Dactylosporangium sp. McL0621]|uniref:CbtB domain-containing protein n=1 Tax=Dactylosporangium sp. McL0621 TaxID=3415678 RepID=UPI003CF5AB28
MSASSSTPAVVTTPVVIPLSRSFVWLAGTAALALLLYYFIGVDQGAVSIFGSDAHVHEFVHDGRHFLGFPCH